jgi:hypothetical protein
MERRGSNTWLVAVLAIAVGFLAALLLLGGNDSKNTSATVSSGTTVATTTSGAATTTTGTAAPGTGTTSTTTTTAPAAPQSPQATVPSCIALWNQPNNRGPQVFLVNLMSRQPVRVHVGLTAAVPPECVVNIVGNDGTAYTFPEGGGTTFPYAPGAAQAPSSTLTAAEKISNALEQRDGTLKAR